MDSILAGALSAVLRLQDFVTVAVLAAFLGVGLRALLRAVLGQRLLHPRLRLAQQPRRRRVVVALAHLLWAALTLACGALYGVFVLSSIAWSPTTLLVAGVTLLAILGALVLKRLLGWKGPGGVTGLLLRAVLVLSLTVLALATLMRAGFLALTEDRPVLLVELTGATAEEDVRWAPAGGELRAERLATHQVVLRRPVDGAVTGEAWVYGDEIAVKGRVLRLSPILNAAGIANLFELQFAFNGYRSVERHNTYPHRAFPLAPAGPLAVHPLWRRAQQGLIERWESGTADGSTWLVRSATTESTYFPMADPTGQPIKRTYRLMLTPGGLSAS
jgi:hypothetical protein